MKRRMFNLRPIGSVLSLFRLCTAWGLIVVCLVGIESKAAIQVLFIAVSKYPPQSMWADTSADRDMDAINQLFNKKGVPKTDIRLVLNEKATYHSIIEHFGTQERALQSGDTLFLFFSGHGQQIIDDNGDEEDGWDEAFIPYDAQKRFKKGVYEGEKHLRDDEIGRWLDRFRKKVGSKGAVWVFIDACHSGTANRDTYTIPIRGTTYLFHDPSLDVAPPTKNSQSFRIKPEKGMSPIGVFSACLPDQVNYEYKSKGSYKSYGRLSYAFLLEVNNGATFKSYTGFYELLKSRINKMNREQEVKQTPYFESTDPIIK